MAAPTHRCSHAPLSRAILPSTNGGSRMQHEAWFVEQFAASLARLETTGWHDHDVVFDALEASVSESTS